MPSKPLGTGLRPWKEGRQGGRKERGQLGVGEERKIWDQPMASTETVSL